MALADGWALASAPGVSVAGYMYELLGVCASGRGRGGGCLYNWGNKVTMQYGCGRIFENAVEGTPVEQFTAFPANVTCLGVWKPGLEPDRSVSCLYSGKKQFRLVLHS